MLRRRTVAVATLILTTGTLVATAAAASEHETLPRHGHMLLLDATLEFTEAGPQVTYAKCIDLADNQHLTLKAHHEHLHFGRAGEAQQIAGNVVVPTAPAFDLPWTDCASFATFFPAG
jgi:hypothetical protein